MSRPLRPRSTLTSIPLARTHRWFNLYLVCCVVGVLIAFALRIHQLGGQSVWFDEGWSWYLAGLPLGEMVNITAGDRSPALYYLLLHGWVALAGASEFALRYLSLGADVVTVVLVMGLAGRLARRFETRNEFPFASIAAGLLYILCPLAVFYAQETRMYALVAMLCTASSYALVRYMQLKHGRRWLVISALGLALAIHSH